jgi:hypothetical protein
VGTRRTAAHRLRLHDQGGKIVEIDLVADPARLRQLDLEVLGQ